MSKAAAADVSATGGAGLGKRSAMGLNKMKPANMASRRMSHAMGAES
jgi:hypothetical protein